MPVFSHFHVYALKEEISVFFLFTAVSSAPKEVLDL